MGRHSFGHQHIIEKPIGVEFVGPMGIHRVQTPSEVMRIHDLTMAEGSPFVLRHEFLDQVVEPRYADPGFTVVLIIVVIADMEEIIPVVKYADTSKRMTHFLYDCDSSFIRLAFW